MYTEQFFGAIFEFKSFDDLKKARKFEGGCGSIFGFYDKLDAEKISYEVSFK